MFLKVDCGGISESLTESELFGYMPGAFTGAGNKGKSGYFEMADGGTVFLDEIGELSLAMQTRLLRVLQDGEIMRVGSSKPRKVNVRIIAATNRNLAERVEKGLFRRDLYYRLNVAVVNIPPLRERPDDIQPLVTHFLNMFTSKYRKHMNLTPGLMEALRQFSWPGNVRELQNLMHSIVITKDHGPLSVKDLPRHMTGNENEELFFPDDGINYERPLKDIMADIERGILRKALKVHGSVQKVAEVFKVNRSTIFRKLHSEKDGGNRILRGKGKLSEKVSPSPSKPPPSSSKTFINGTEYDFGIAGAVPWRQFPGDAFSNTSRRRHETMQDHRPQAAF